MVQCEGLNIIVVLLVAFHGLTKVNADDDDWKKSRCVIQRGKPDDPKDPEPLWILCNNIGGDGRTFDEILKKEQLLDLGTEHSPSPKRYSIDKIAGRVNAIDINGKGSINIPKGTFSIFPALEELNFNGEISGIIENGSLSIYKDELTTISHLRNISIRHLALSDDAVKALNSTTSRLIKLKITNSTPNRAILDILGDFSNLIQLDLEEVHDETSEDVKDATVFQKSAPKLEWIYLHNANITKIPKGLLHGLVNLKTLFIMDSNVQEIEPGAFDDLKNLEIIFLTGNKLKHLPDGLFDKNQNLERAILYNNNITNISPANFTNHKNFKELELEAPIIVPL